MRAYIETAKTNPDTTDEELLRMAEEYAEMETDAEAVKTKKVNTFHLFHKISKFEFLSADCCAEF